VSQDQRGSVLVEIGWASCRRRATKEYPMSAYVIVQETVHDQAMFDTYRKDVPATIAAHDGKFLVRGGVLSVLEGEWKIPRIVVVEFPNRAAAEAWYNSREYQKLVPLRRNSTTGNFIVVDGI
jgi:uncharacterized protein (DUF1330 family)